MNNLTRETRLALFREYFGLMEDYVERFLEKYPEQQAQAFCLGTDTLIHCISHYNPEKGEFIRYLRASLRLNFKKLKIQVARFSELARYNEDGEEVEFDTPAQSQSGEDLSLVGLEGTNYTDEERDAVRSVYQKLEEMDPDLALVFRLGFEEGLSLQEIGHKMGYSRATAWRRKQAARKLARDILRDMGLYDRPIYRRDWGETMVDSSLLRPYEEMPDRQFPPGWTRHFSPDETRRRRRRGYLVSDHYPSK